MQLTVRFIAVCALGFLGATPAWAQWSTHSLASSRGNISAVTVGGKSLFAGGGIGNGIPVDAVDIYDPSLGAPTDPAAWSTATLSQARHHIAGTAVGPYALFAGGGVSLSAESAVVDVYDVTDGTWSTANPLSVARNAITATTVGTKAIFAGGTTGGMLPGSPSDVVDIYDWSKGAPSDPAAWSTATLSVARGGAAAASVGNWALFAGGASDWYANAIYDTVDIYDDSTGTWSTWQLTEARALLASTQLGTRAYFGGGFSSITTDSDVVDTYDASKGAPTDPAAWSTEQLPSGTRGDVAATSVGNWVLFAGGSLASGAGCVDFVDMLDVETGSWTQSSISQPREMIGATSVGNLALFAGGGCGAPGAVVDVFTGPGPVSYCTAKLNSCGTLPTISGTGTPSATTDSGFTVDAANTKALKAGLLIYSDSGRANIPFVGGLLCVNPMPLKRSTAVIDSKGTPGQCNGTLSIDMNAFAVGALGGNPLPSLTIPGTRITCQFWGRDTIANGALLSDALEYFVGM